MFGIKTNNRCEAYGLKGLYVIGEAACWDMHGFNRLGGNSLLETIAAGYIAGKNAAEYVLMRDSINIKEAAAECLKQTRRINFIIQNSGKENVFGLFKEMQNILSEKAGIFRKGDDLEKAICKLLTLQIKSHNLTLRCKTMGPNLELQIALRLPGMIKLALCVAQASLLRKESRGSHFRKDYPNRDDDNWLKRTLTYFPENSDLPEIKYEPVKITILPPGDRGYGEKKMNHQIRDKR